MYLVLQSEACTEGVEGGGDVAVEHDIWGRLVGRLRPAVRVQLLHIQGGRGQVEVARLSSATFCHCRLFPANPEYGRCS